MEFMIGIGPEWIHANERSMTANSVAGEGILDFMYWPSAKHKFGWYVEPGYEYSFGRGHEQSVGISGGLLSRFHERRGIVGCSVNPATEGYAPTAERVISGSRTTLACRPSHGTDTPKRAHQKTAKMYTLSGDGAPP